MRTEQYLEQVNHSGHLHHNFCMPKHIHLRFLMHKPPCHQLADAHTYAADKSLINYLTLSIEIKAFS